MRTTSYQKLVYRVILLLLVTSVGYDAHAQIITTVAGNGSGGYGGDGGGATAAELNQPFGVAVDGSGSIYIADSYNNCVRKVTASGTISTIAGSRSIGFSGDGGPATLAQLNYPTAVAVDRNGNVYIADTYNSSIRMVTPAGTISTFAGSDASGFYGDGGSALTAKLNQPEGIAVDNDSNVYIADTYNNCIRKVNAAGVINSIAGNTTMGFSGDGGNALRAELNQPQGIALYHDSILYIADVHNQRIRMLDTGIITTVAGDGVEGISGDGGPATAARFNQPYGVATDKAGNIYVADWGNGRIRRITQSGTIITYAGGGTDGLGDGGPSVAAQLSHPTGIAADSIGELYIADLGDNRIRRVGAPTNAVINVGNPTSLNLSVFPNPNSGSFTLNLSSPANAAATITITNMLGEKVKEFTITTNKQTGMQLGAPPGVYFISGVTDSGSVCGKVVVE